MSGGGSGSQTNTVSQQIPLYEQQFSQQNQNLAQSLGAQQYPTYQAPLVADLNPTQQTGQQAALNAANSYQPGITAAQNGLAGVSAANNPALAQQSLNIGAGTVAGALQQNPLAYGQQNQNLGAFDVQNALNHSANNPGVIQSYMSPYVQAALQPQVLALQTQLGQQQNQIAANATQANAFGDARQGAQSALANFYGDQSLSGLEAQGYNTAYQQALSAAQQQQQMGLSGGQALGQLGLGQTQAALGAQGQQIQGGNELSQMGQNQLGLGLQTAGAYGNLGSLTQNLGLQGANAIYNAGQQQQQVQQQELNTAYQQFQNQVQWPFQMLNVQESALSNSPYNMTTQTTLPNANMAAQNIGAFASLAGGLGSLFGGGSSVAPYGGQPYPSPH